MQTCSSAVLWRGTKVHQRFAHCGVWVSEVKVRFVDIDTPSDWRGLLINIVDHCQRGRRGGCPGGVRLRGVALKSRQGVSRRY